MTCACGWTLTRELVMLGVVAHRCDFDGAERWIPVTDAQRREVMS